jgi:hypothetical protein
MHKISAIVCLLAGLLFAACNFPSDPPLKKAAPVNPVNPIDSAECLLPLKMNNKWQYTVVPRVGQQQSYQTTAVEIMYYGKTYFDIRYVIDDKPPINYAMPCYIQSDSAGLSFFDYDPGPPDTLVEQYFLKYPSSVGTVWSKGTVSVETVAKDTTIMDITNTTGYKTYRYDIRDKGNRTLSVFVIPGKAIFKIEGKNYTIYTIGWRIE